MIGFCEIGLTVYKICKIYKMKNECVPLMCLSFCPSNGIFPISSQHMKKQIYGSEFSKHGLLWINHNGIPIVGLVSVLRRP